MEIDRLSFADRAAARLRHEIVHGTLPPGTRLVEMELAARLGIGRGTVRAALSALEAEDLVVKQPYTGWAVQEISGQELWETYTLRSALEGLAARLVAGSLTAEVRSTLDKALQRLREAEESGVGGERVDADLDFHRTLVNLAGHRGLSRQYFGLSNKFEWLYRWSETHWPCRINLVSWHQPIIDAVLSGEPSVAEQAIREHCENSLADDAHDFAELQRQLA